MKLEIQNRPMSRGVSQLMYVGDDDAVENATGLTAERKVQLASAAVLAYAMFGPKKHRNVALGASLAIALFPYTWG